ncbi:MAG TPA: EthD family reductase [Gammaproteobacteria bacterium]|nr:EthD family reductase [Gammaproteobacteria bacterium]
MIDETDRNTEEPKDPGRRDAMATAIAAALGGVALVASSGSAEAFENKEGDKCLTVLFPSGKDHEFDIEYYTKHHIPFVLSLYGDSIRNYEVFQGQPGRDGSPPPFLAMANIWIADEKAYAEASRKHAKDFMPDVKNFTNIKTIGQTNVLYKVIKPA